MTEKMKQPKSKRRWPSLLLLAGLVSVATVCAADTQLFTKDSGNLMDDSDVAANRIGTVDKGQLVTVLQAQDGWSQIQFTTKDGKTVTGWLVSGDLSEQKPGTDIFANSGGNGNATASTATFAAAGKGMGPDALDWSKAVGKDPSMVLQMEAVRAGVTPADRKAFDNSPEGKLGV